MKQPAERIELPTPFPVGGVNAYYLAGRVPTLVDTGCATEAARRALDKALADRPVDQVVVSHGHVDHFGLAAHLRASRGARIVVHEADAPRLERFEADAESRAQAHADGLHRAGVPEEVVHRLRREARKYDAWGVSCTVDRRLAPTDVIQMGDTRYAVEHAPGHTPGSIVLRADDASHSFTGDTLLERITPNALSVSPDDRGALPTYLRTLGRLAQQDLGTILPGHGAPFPDHRGAIQRALRHAEIRQERLLGLAWRGPRTAYELVGDLFRTLPGDQMFLAVSEVTGHLDELERRGLVERTESGGVERHRSRDAAPEA